MGLHIYSVSGIDLRRESARFSRILVRVLRERSRFRGSDSDEIYRLSKLAMEALDFRRSLLKHRRGPRGSEKREIDGLENQVQSVMRELEKDSVDRVP